MFLPLLGGREFATSHEARVAQVARQMAASGWPWDATPVAVDRVRPVKRFGVVRLMPDPGAERLKVNPWIVPVLNQRIRLQKPPLAYWCAAVLFRWFGTGEAAARFVPALLGMLATLIVFDLARLLYGPRVAWLAAPIWPTTFIVSQDYRLAMTDPYLAFFTLVGVWSWIRAATGDLHSSGRRLMGFYLAVALGALAKGPLIVADLVIPLGLFHVCFRARWPGRPMVHLLGVCLCAAVVSPWVAAVLRATPEATSLWWYESVGELLGTKPEGLRAGWYYLQNLPLLSLPWTPLWLFSLIYPVFKRVNATELFPVLWAATSIVFFSVMGQKKMPYLLPMMPAQALVIALGARYLMEEVGRGGIVGVVMAAQALVGVGWAAVSLHLVRTSIAGALPVSLGVAALLVALLPVGAIIAGRPARSLALQAVVYAAVISIFCADYLTPANNARSPKRLARELTSLADGRHRAILQPVVPEEVAFYLPLDLSAGPAPGEYLLVIDDQKGAKERLRTHQPEHLPDPMDYQRWIPDAKVIGLRRLAMESAPGDARWKVYAIIVERKALALISGGWD